MLSSQNFEDVGFPDDRALGASFFNFWDVEERENKPNFGGELEVGYRFDFDNGMSLGILAAGKYDNDYAQTEEDFARYIFTGGGNANQAVDYEQRITKQTINLSGFLNIGLELNNDHSIAVTRVFLRQTDNEIAQQRGITSEFGLEFDEETVENYRFQWTENEIASTAVKGEHFFNIGENINGARLNWRFVDGSGRRESPDTRTYTYFQAPGNLDLDPATPPVVIDNLHDSTTQLDALEIFVAPDRQWEKLEDDIEEYGVDLEVPLLLADGAIDLLIKVGFSEYERTRESEDRLFRFDLTNTAPDFVRWQTPSQLFSLENWGAGYLDVTDFSARAADTSSIFPFAASGEETSAYYAAFDVQLTPRLRIQGGVREEETELFADAWGGSTLPGTVNAVSNDFDDSLPAASVTYEFINDMQLRFAYSETVNRPSLLEITGTTLRNPEDQQFYRGNVFLEPANLENFDVRYEWYFGEADSLSVGVFMKDFDAPIELGRITAENEIFTWFNAEEAELEGVEIELRKDLFLDRWFDWGQDWDYFTLSANVSFIDSKVTLLGNGETAADIPLTGGRQLDSLFENERDLTGQSDVLGNLILSYSNYDLGLEGSLAYNYTGERIVLTGAVNAPNVIEEARSKLDLLLKYVLPIFDDEEVELELKVQNILDAEIEWTQGGLLYEKFNPGVGFSLSAKYVW